MQTHIFTDDDFSAFKSAIEKWIADFGITGWEVEIRHEQIEDKGIAQVCSDQVGRNALFRLTRQVESAYGLEKDPVKLAIHEVLHLLLADFAWTISSSDGEYSEISMGHEHSIIHRLFKILTGKKQ